MMTTLALELLIPPNETTKGNMTISNENKAPQEQKHNDQVHVTEIDQNKQKKEESSKRSSNGPSQIAGNGVTGVTGNTPKE